MTTIVNAECVTKMNKDELARLVKILEGRGLYINHYEPKRQELLWDMCRAAFWYRTILDSSNREIAKSITFDDLATAFGQAAEGDSNEKV